ncbi:MAG: outer membrane protein transport protein [Deltaproteobacteria bacterium]|nr:MAG: outer membrane protein transport protein [Deltaproteobacteria bacterium]
MKTRWFPCWLGTLCLLLIPAIALGSGYGINEQGTKAFAMGGAFVAQADDPSAVYFNPAGIVQLEGTQVSAGSAFIAPFSTFNSNGTSQFSPPSPKPDAVAGTKTDSVDKTFVIPNLYLTHQLSEKVSLGLGTFVNFGLAQEYPAEWEGRFALGGVESEIETFSINPVFAYRPHEKVSLGIGFVAQYLDARLRNRFLIPGGLPNAGGEADVDFNGDGDWGLGWNLGLLVWITDNLKFGASYRSQVNHSLEGKVTTTLPQPEATLLGSEANFSVGIKTPTIFYLGAAYNYKAFTIEIDGQWTQWSAFKSLSASFDQRVLNQTGITSPQYWSDVWAFRLGLQYAVTQWLDLRGGFIYDEGPVPDETLAPFLPSGDRFLYSIGFGTHYKALTFDLGYSYLDDENRTWDNSKGDVTTSLVPTTTRVTGTFENTGAHLVMFNLSYKF